MHSQTRQRRLCLTISLGEVSDIAETAAFLASDKASYITGQVIKVDGGMSL